MLRAAYNLDIDNNANDNINEILSSIMIKENYKFGDIHDVGY